MGLFLLHTVDRLGDTYLAKSTGTGGGGEERPKVDQLHKDHHRLCCPSFSKDA